MSLSLEELGAESRAHGLRALMVVWEHRETGELGYGSVGKGLLHASHRCLDGRYSP